MMVGDYGLTPPAGWSYPQPNPAAEKLISWKAGRTIQEVQPLVLEFTRDADELATQCIVDGLADLGKLRQLYETEGDRLAESMMRHLPGGLLDGLMCALMRRRSSLFVVPFVSAEERKP